MKPTQAECARQLEEGRELYAAYLESLPGYIDLGSHVVVHAGLRPGVSLAEQSLDDLTALRTLGPDRESREGTPWYEVYDGERTALFGHWPAARAASGAARHRPRHRLRLRLQAHRLRHRDRRVPQRHGAARVRFAEVDSRQ